VAAVLTTVIVSAVIISTATADGLLSFFPCGAWSALALAAWGTAFASAVSLIGSLPGLDWEFSRLTAMVPAVAPYLLLQLFTLHFFASIGICAWGDLRPEAHAGTAYERSGYVEVLNFQDYGKAMLLLMHVLSLSNWSVTADAYVIASGRFWVFAWLYFLLFIWCNVLIVLNVLNGALIELYDALQREDELTRAGVLRRTAYNEEGVRTGRIAKSARGWRMSSVWSTLLDAFHAHADRRASVFEPVRIILGSAQVGLTSGQSRPPGHTRGGSPHRVATARGGVGARRVSTTAEMPAVLGKGASSFSRSARFICSSALSRQDTLDIRRLNAKRMSMGADLEGGNFSDSDSSVDSHSASRRPG